MQPKDVLETHQNIVKYKLSMEDGTGETAKLCSEYNKFLSHCNAVDFVDVLQRVKTCFIMDSDAKIKFQTVQQFVVVGKPKTQLEVSKIFKLCTLHVDTSLQGHDLKRNSFRKSVIIVID